jgi:ketosteroid isomerase-like protein
MNAADEDKTRIIEAHREAYRAMLAANINQLAPLLDDGYSLTHMTGRRQPKKEWLEAIKSGEMRYHAEREESVTVNVTGDTAVLVGQSVVTATIYGGRGTWNLQLTTNYRRKDGKWIAESTVATTY